MYWSPCYHPCYLAGHTMPLKIILFRTQSKVCQHQQALQHLVFSCLIPPCPVPFHASLLQSLGLCFLSQPSERHLPCLCTLCSLHLQSSSCRLMCNWLLTSFGSLFKCSCVQWGLPRKSHLTSQPLSSSTGITTRTFLFFFLPNSVFKTHLTYYVSCYL